MIERLKLMKAMDRNQGPLSEMYESILNDALAEIGRLAQENERLTAEGGIMRGLLRAAVCPDSNCNKSGTVCLGVHEHESGELEYDIHQCEWCDRRKIAVSDKLEQSIEENQELGESLAESGQCRKCGGDMKPSKATEQTWVAGIPDFPSDKLGMRGATLSPGGPGKLIDSMKCSECGWSVTAEGRLGLPGHCPRCGQPHDVGNPCKDMRGSVPAEQGQKP